MMLRIARVTLQRHNDVHEWRIHLPVWILRMWKVHDRQSDPIANRLHRLDNHLINNVIFSLDELARRVVSPERVKQFKEIDAEAEHDTATRYQLFRPDSSDTFELDITVISADTAARLISDRFRNCRRNAGGHRPPLQGFL
jgi:hypothetical protein